MGGGIGFGWVWVGFGVKGTPHSYEKGTWDPILITGSPKIL